jgi:hypothetical protein
VNRFTWLCLVFIAAPTVAAAQDFQVGAQLGWARSERFDASELGFGGRLSWHPLALVGVESEFNLYPAEFPDRFPFRGRRVEGLFGATVGPRLDRLRPFGRLRLGFVHDEGRAVVCVAIFPPPLGCLMAAGGSHAIADLGGGVEFYTSPRTFARVDAGDRMIRYPAPTLESRDHKFFGHDFRLAVGGGWRF